MAALDQLIRELLETATRSDDPAELIELACAGLCELGVPLWRFSVGIQTIDPTVRAVSYVWLRDRGLSREATPYVPGPDSDLPYRRSPIYALVQDGLTCRHWRLDRGEGCSDLPLLAELRAAGATSYFLHIVRFSGEIAAAVPGVAIGMATDRPGGFTETDIASFVFRVRNLPAALYKALGGFATNGVNMTKLESYQLEGSFNATMFYADIEGHPDDRSVALALEELHFFSSEVTVLGTYPASPFRAELKALEG
jgi:hypothetical protein